MATASSDPRMVAECELISSVVQTAIEENSKISTLQFQDAIKLNVEMVRTEIVKTMETNNTAIMQAMHKALIEAEKVNQKFAISIREYYRFFRF